MKGKGRTSPAGERGVIDAAPASLGGQIPVFTAQQRSGCHLPWDVLRSLSNNAPGVRLHLRLYLKILLFINLYLICFIMFFADLFVIMVYIVYYKSAKNIIKHIRYKLMNNNILR